jgi:hypothetical protein
MPSGLRREPRSQETTVFFLDRSVGRHDVADALRQRGFEVVLMHELYPGGSDQSVGDNDWIERVADLHHIAITKDLNIIRAHGDAIRESGIRLFSFDSARLTGPEMAGRIDRHLNRILQRASKPGPYFYVIHSDSLELRWRAVHDG